MARKEFYERGQEYLQAGKYQEAAIEFRNALKVSPDYAEAHYSLGVAYFQLRQWREAYQAFQLAVELQPRFRPAQLRLGELLLRMGRAFEARQIAEEILAVEPDNLDARALLARSYMGEKDFARAVEQFDWLKQRRPRDPVAYVTAGVARVAAGDYRHAEVDLRQALELDPANLDAYRNLASLYEMTRQPDRAVSLLRNRLEQDPDNLELGLVLAEAYFRQGQREAVEKLFQAFRQRTPQRADWRLLMGDFWMWHTEVGPAAREFAAALSLEPNLGTQKKLISAYITLGRWEEAERLNQQLLARNPRDAEGHAFRGALRHLRGDSQQAIVDLRAALKEQPQSPFTTYYLGLALMATGNFHEAETAFADCVRLNDKFVHAFQKLAELRLQREDGKVAEDYAQKVIALTPQRPEGYLLLAQAYLQQGEGRKAELVLKQVKKGMPQSASVQELLATAYLTQGKMEAGIHEYEQAWMRSQHPASSLNRFVELLVARNQVEVAIRRVRQAVAEVPQPSYFEILARLYLSQGNLQQAETAAQEALRLDESRWMPRFYLAQIRDRQARPEEALAYYDEVIRLQPQQIPPYILAGDLCLRQGSLDQAGRYYEAARRRDADSPLVRHALARLWVEQGDRIDEAMATVQGLLRDFPEDPDLSDTLAWIYFKKGWYSAALPLLKRCVAQKPQSALFQFHLGMTYWKMGDHRSGRQALETALKSGLHSPLQEAMAQEVLARAG